MGTRAAAPQGPGAPSADEAARPASGELVAVVDAVTEPDDDQPRGEGTTLGGLLDRVGTRSYGPLLMVLALVAISPIGAIPGMSVVTGSLIILVAAQMLAGFEHPWMPRRLLAISIGSEPVDDAGRTMRPWAKWLEGWFAPRLVALAEPPVTRLVALACIALAATFYPLALLPFAVAVPGIAVLLLAIGLTVRDGVVILLGLAGTSGALTMTYLYWPF